MSLNPIDGGLFYAHPAESIHTDVYDSLKAFAKTVSANRDYVHQSSINETVNDVRSAEASLIEKVAPDLLVSYLQLPGHSNASMSQMKSDLFGMRQAAAAEAMETEQAPTGFYGQFAHETLSAVADVLNLQSTVSKDDRLDIPQIGATGADKARAKLGAVADALRHDQFPQETSFEQAFISQSPIARDVVSQAAASGCELDAALRNVRSELPQIDLRRDAPHTQPLPTSMDAALRASFVEIGTDLGQPNDWDGGVRQFNTLLSNAKGGSDTVSNDGSYRAQQWRAKATPE